MTDSSIFDWIAENPFTKNVPGLGQAGNAGVHFENGDLASVATDIGDLALNVAATWADPLGALIGAGLGFLIDVCEPLREMLNWVTGDADAIGKHRDQWRTVGQQLLRLADELSATLTADWAEWQGEASAAAKAKLDGFITGVRETAAETGNLMAVLAFSGALMTIAQDVIKDLISQFVEWLIVTWLAAQAAAIPTCGASEVAAGAATAGEAAVATSRGAAIISKVIAIFKKLEAILARIAKSLQEMRASSILKLTGKGGNKALGPGGLGKDLVEAGREARLALRPRNGGTRQPFDIDWSDTIKNGVLKGSGGILQGVEDDQGQNPSSEEIDRLLNP